MSNIAPIATQTSKAATGQMATGLTALGAQGGALAGAQGGVFGALAGMNFMDMIFARTAPAQDGATSAQTAGAQVTGQKTEGEAILKAAVTVHPAFATHAPAVTPEQLAQNMAVKKTGTPIVSAALHREAGIDIEELTALLAALSGDAELTGPVMTIDGPVENAPGQEDTIVTTGDLAALPLTPAQHKEFMTFLKNMLRGLPAADETAATDMALVATNLTPATLTELIQQLQAQDKMAAGGDPVNITAPKNVSAATDGDAAGNDEALNAAIVMPFAVVPLDGSSAVADGSVDAAMNDIIPAAGRGEKPVFSAAAPVTAGTTAQTALTAGYVPNAAAANNAASAQGAGGSSFAAAQAAAQGESLLDSAGWSSIYPDGLEWTQGGTAHNTLSLTGAAQFTSLVAHAQTAAAPHPATQIVAATLTKGAQEGESKSMTLKLDPPELGRIEIRMDFAKEKGMKAHIVMEKPETYMMMQRDAHILERALQDAGIDSNGGLSFELAQDGNLFGDGHEGSNRHGGGSGGKQDADDGMELAIETTMDWYVDQDGFTRYDILA